MAITNQMQRPSARMSFVMAMLNKRAGQQMCEMREKLGLTMRDVHDLSRRIAKSLRNRDYIISPSRLSDIESKGKTPNLYRLHAVSLAYDCKVEKLLHFYGIADGRGGGRR
jgi:transcriptional regulator with XRE-family HTH domain